MVQASDLNGLWNGQFSYFASEDIGHWPFKARLVGKEGRLSGVVIEPHVNGTGEVKADLEGTFEGSKVSFVKRYQSTSDEYARAVSYEGQVSADGKTIAGTWTHSDSSGPFEMMLGK